MLTLENICKKLGGFSLKNINLSVDKGDYFVLMGETGSGKSMLLEIITGLLMPDEGQVWLNGKNLADTPSQQRNIGMVYQKPSLFPHLSVFQNIAYPLKIRKKGRAEIEARVRELAVELGIKSLLGRDIKNLSGGEAQRVTIARTLASAPEILLLDEPLSYLDVKLKREMISLLSEINQKGITIIHVTHDDVEARALARTMGFIRNGVLLQTGLPELILPFASKELL